MKSKKEEKLYTLKEACELLSISTATGRNWMKTGRLVSDGLLSGKPAFTEHTLLSLKEALTAGTISGLKGRRNKSCITGSQTCHSYIDKNSVNHTALKQTLLLLEQKHLVLEDTLLLCLLRSCAECLIYGAGYKNLFLFGYLLDNLVSSSGFSVFQKMHPDLYKVSYTYLPSEDTLGFLYLSLRNLRDRKASGSYYTPAGLVQKLVAQHLPAIDSKKEIFDPSCGTGIFLLQLPDIVPLKHIYGSDLNPISIILTRINLALKYKVSSLSEIETLKKNITVSDFLVSPAENEHQKSSAAEATHNSYDIILGNPPWGARLTKKEKEKYREKFFCASGTFVEIYDLFIEQSLQQLSSGGILSFIVPEALLTVKSHTSIRKLLLKETSVRSVEYLGEVFEQVHCPSIILTVAKNTAQPFYKNVSVTLENGTSFSTQVERSFSADFFSFLTTDEEYLLLQKLLTVSNCVTLKEKAEFALGIVTGNNAALLRRNHSTGLEPIIKGSDISKYHINSHSGYVAFQPELFQQTAPERFYRAPEKLFYRFINKKLVFAYDDTGLLSLNSCNIVIPHIKGLSTKYILAVLNSGVAQFIFEKQFHSVKVLRSHLEQLPIPLAETKTQEEIEKLVDRLMSINEKSQEYKETYKLLDLKIAELFSLTQNEFEIIRS